MKKNQILSGANYLFLPILYLCLELGCVLLCSFVIVENALKYTLLALVSVGFIMTMIVSNRIVTIVTFDPEKKIVTRRGLFWGFCRELRVDDIIRTEVLTIPKESEYIFLIDKDMDPCFESLSANTPIRLPNSAKGRAFIALFYAHRQ